MKNSKKNLSSLILPILLLAFSFFSTSCSEDDEETPLYECATCVDTPDARAENDNSVKGVYKGIVVGSSGSLYIDIQNGSNTITGIMILDGTTINLTSSVSYVEGEAYLAPFVGMYNGAELSLTFSVSLGGSNPTMVTSDIPGHPNASFTIYKETSTSLIEAFEGTYSKPGETGIFNIILSRELNLWGGIAREDAPDDDPSEIDGIINSSNELISGENGIKVGKITGDVITGSFTDTDNTVVTVNGQRTL